MYKALVAFAVLLLVSALAVIFLPLYLPAVPRGGAHTEAIGGVGLTQMQGALLQVRQIAEQVNAPLSVVVALLSLFYSRRGYLVQKRRNEQQ